VTLGQVAKVGGGAKPAVSMPSLVKKLNVPPPGSDF
jgi:hypothetical protein